MVDFLFSGTTQTKTQAALMQQRSSKRLHIHMAFSLILRSEGSMMPLGLRYLYALLEKPL